MTTIEPIEGRINLKDTLFANADREASEPTIEDINYIINLKRTLFARADREGYSHAQALKMYYI